MSQKSVLELFNIKYIPEASGCWMWTGATSLQGYGKMKYNGQVVHAHRVSHELFKGPIPEGFQIDHLCRNRACVNPDHLEAVVPRENIRRGSGCGGVLHSPITHCKHGHKYTKQTTSKRKSGRACLICKSIYDRQNRRRINEARRQRRKLKKLLNVAGWT